MKISFNYTNGNAFNLNNEPYTGYYNITDGIVYTGRELQNSSLPLDAQENILGNYITTKYIFNRSTDTNLVLTYTMSDLEFQPNEIVNQNSINDKLDKLYSNFLELYNFCFIQDNNLPANYSGYFGVSSNDSLVYTNVKSTEFYSLSTIARSLTGLKGFDVIGMNLARNDGSTTASSCLLIGFIPSTLYFYKVSNTPDAETTSTFLFSTTYADGFGSQPFINITDITTNNKDTLFVNDAVNNQIYRLYIDPILNESRINSANLDLLNTGGLKINTTGNDFLSGATLLYYFANEIYTYNQGRKSITVLDDNLAFKREFSNTKLKTSNVADFAINPIDEKVYILMDNFEIIEIKKDFTGQTNITKHNNFTDSEIPKRILFSDNDSNLYYILTTNNVYKYYNSAKDKLIGNFKWHSTTNINLSSTDREIFDAKILLENEDYDSLFILDKDVTAFSTTSAYTGRDRILRFTETNNQVTCLDNINFNIFTLNDIRVNSQYFNNITFNKSIKKILFNLDILSSFILSNFTYSYVNEELVYSSNLILSSNIYVEKDYNYFVGVNETVSPQVLNRCIGRLYNYQNIILNSLEKRIKNLRYPISQVVNF